jgi:hypothetical protein
MGLVYGANTRLRKYGSYDVSARVSVTAPAPSRYARSQPRQAVTCDVMGGSRGPNERER